MADQSSGTSPGRASTTGVRPWQIVVGALGIIVVVGVAILMFGGEGHGPARHAPAGDAAASLTVAGEQVRRA